jgi:LPXTG-site transpeptidase (sortase) family protein
MVRRVLTAPWLQRQAGALLIACGAVVASVVLVRVAREEVELAVAERSQRLLLASTPVLGLPPATPLPTFTPLPTATPIVKPPPAVRLYIPTIGLNTSIQESPFTLETDPWGEPYLLWGSVPNAAAHISASGNPGEGTNIVLLGHNNMEGAVFRDLPLLQTGDDLTLVTDQAMHHYRVKDRQILLVAGREPEFEAELASFLALTRSEQVTLISCWPDYSNTHRIIVVAEATTVEP